MDPAIGRVAFNLAILFVILSLIPLPFMDTRSAEFVVDVIALAVSALFLTLLTWDVRRQVRMTKPRKATEETS